MDAQLASGVSDETSPTCRESPVQFKQRLVIAFVRRTDGLHILASDRTFPADHRFRPYRDGAPISFEPDVREHPRPAAVAVEEMPANDVRHVKPHPTPALPPKVAHTHRAKKGGSSCQERGVIVPS